MFLTPAKSRQPNQPAWSHEHLYRERAIALGYTLDNSMIQTYNSHLQSFLSFCKLHTFPLDPTPDTLSFFIIFMGHHIKPISVTQYLSGIVNSLEPYFPDVRKNRHSVLITRTLAGMHKLRGFTGTHQKQALTEDDLLLLQLTYDSTNLNDLLFLAIIFSSFHALLQLGE